jgi:hypothetical protein
MQLGPCLLQQNNPKFIAIGCREDRLLILARNKVINDNHLLDSILGYIQSKNALLVDLVCFKEALDPVWLLCEHAEHTEKVAVAEGSLLDISWLNFACKNLEFALVIIETGYISGPDPLESPPFVFDGHDVRRLVLPVINERRGTCREVLVNEGLAIHLALQLKGDEAGRHHIFFTRHTTLISHFFKRIIIEFLSK